jgi:hypothetical protein
VINDRKELSNSKKVKNPANEITKQVGVTEQSAINEDKMEDLLKQNILS